MIKRGVVQRTGRACLARILRGGRSAEAPSCRAGGRAGRRAGRSLLRDERGSALVEFGLLAMPFLLLLVGTVEISVMFFTSAVMEGATREAARQIRTGNIQNSGDPVATFQTQLCDALYNVIDCSQVIFNVQTFADFGSVNMPIEVNEDGDIVNAVFAPGGSGAVTVVRTIYRWEFVTPLIGQAMPSGFGGHLLVSTAAFQNEPYNVN